MDNPDCIADLKLPFRCKEAEKKQGDSRDARGNSGGGGKWPLRCPLSATASLEQTPSSGIVRMSGRVFVV